MHVLIADDDPVLGQLLSAAFRKEGWQSSIARDAMQSVMFAMRQPQPDVILLDLSMPAGTGLDVLKKLKLNVRTADIPVIVITGTEAPDLPARATEMGAVAFIAKPLDPAALIARVKEALA